MNSPQNAYSSLRQALQIHPNYLPALICGARVDQVLGNKDEVASLMKSIEQQLGQADSLELEERIDLAVLLVEANQGANAAREITACLHQATARNLRRTGADQLYHLLIMARQMNLADARPGLRSFILNLLPEPVRLQYQLESARYESSQKNSKAALVLLQQALGRNPNDVSAINALSRFLSTSHDEAYRNGRQAVVLALQANELDKNQHPEITDTLACAYAEAGEFGLAQAAEQQAIAAAEASKMSGLAAECHLHLGLFHNNLPFHE
jgi:tetratricopeptide (TPR) repeat protein